MTQLPQQPGPLGSLPAELVLGITRDLEDVTDRIADMKALCDRQMADLADAAAAAAGITEVLARRGLPVEADPDFAALGLELSRLYETVEAQVGTCQRASKQFLAIARDVEAEIAALRAAAPAPAGGTGIAPGENTGRENTGGENVIWLQARRDAGRFRGDAGGQGSAARPPGHAGFNQRPVPGAGGKPENDHLAAPAHARAPAAHARRRCPTRPGSAGSGNSTLARPAWTPRDFLARISRPRFMLGLIY